ncbi:ATP-dependent helicase HrpB [hydrothermal vent metagenome]|uniref:ATP-dependent helicase HrpB n=1 Tax=hydrothermal vent metagenome TaxID=652676 RepID=A0A3B0Y8W4_9ZZZZ
MPLPSLPVNAVIPDIVSALHRHNRVILQAPPGAGKTTAVPISLLNESWLGNRQIIMLEPRRLAARNAASRMAYLSGEPIGQTIGYQIKQDSCFSEHTRILVVTEGILTRKLQNDPELKNTALIIFDEFHERSLHTDLSLALCLQSQEILNEKLKLLIMSATLDTRAISSLVNRGSNCAAPVIKSSGRSFPVAVKFIEKNRYKHIDSPHQQLILNVFDAIKQVIHEHQGSCLVFLPGRKEILTLENTINEYLNSATYELNPGLENIIVAPLYGSLTKTQQDQAILAAPPGKRKFVLATNIAETSLTIEGISCVIDSGLEKVLHYTPSCGMNKLKTQFISHDSATQRSGRAGRLNAGTCYRLWTKHQHSRLLKHATAEILHSDLSSLVLELANWGVQDPDELKWIDTPPDNALRQARTLLKQLNGIDQSGKITPHGQQMLRLGTHPRLSHMMLSSIEYDLAYQACLMAGLLTESDFYQSATDKSTDINDRLNFLFQMSSTSKNSLKKTHLTGINLNTCKRIKQSANDFLKRLARCAGKTLSHKKINTQYTGVLLAHAYTDRIAKQREPGSTRYLLCNGKGASISDFSQPSYWPFLVVAQLDEKHNNRGNSRGDNRQDNRLGEARIFLAAEITEEQIETCFSKLIDTTESILWNEKFQRVECKTISRIGQIVLQQNTTPTSSKEAVHHCLISAIQASGLHSLNWSSQASSLRNRVQFINQFQALNSDHEKSIASGAMSLPDFSDQVLLSSLAHWLLPHLSEENSMKQCQKLNLYALLKCLLSWDQLQYIDTMAPELITVPSGSAIKIDYSDITQPVLAVRLQEVFGLMDTPLLLNGQCKIMLHLLSPARRPVQITQDLNSFWKTAYHDVKKELRGKYKKHYWPEDPLSADATSKTRKNMNNNRH